MHVYFLENVCVRYEYNVDVTMTVMKLVDEDDDEMGMLK